MSKRQAGIVVSGYDAKSQLVLWRTLESKLLAAEKKFNSESSSRPRSAVVLQFWIIAMLSKYGRDPLLTTATQSKISKEKIYQRNYFTMDASIR